MPNRTVPTLEELLTLNKVQQTLRLTEVNQHLESLSAQERVVWALEIYKAIMHCHRAWYPSRSDASSTDFSEE